MGSPITDEQRKEYEKFIAEHPPYDKDDPVMKVFDPPEVDNDRMFATTLKMLLDGKLD